jgi:IS30 family transposase
MPADLPAVKLAVGSPNYLATIASEINDRPRKIHNWKKPSELVTELVETHASTA